MTTAAFTHPPSGIVVDAQGHIYILYHGLVRIEPSGQLTTLQQDTGGHWLAWDKSGASSKVPTAYRNTSDGQMAKYWFLVTVLRLPSESTALSTMEVTDYKRLRFPRERCDVEPDHQAESRRIYCEDCLSRGGEGLRCRSRRSQSGKPSPGSERTWRRFPGKRVSCGHQLPSSSEDYARRSDYVDP
jgi:hypothetical protein